VSPAELHVDDRDLDLARTTALSTYARLLADEAAFRPEESRAVLLRSTPVLPPPQPGDVPAREPATAAPGSPADAPRAGRPAWVLPAAAGLAVVLVAAVVWKVLLAPSNDVLSSVTASAAPYGATTCDADAVVLLSGVLAAAGDADVAYHWQDPGSGWRTRSRQVRVHAGRTTTVTATMPVPVRAGQTTRGTVTLVVESPDERTAKASYAVDCIGG
jgi:hypothetical protein